MKRSIALLLLLSLYLINICAQRTERVHGEYTYYVPENVSVDEGKRTALYRAQIQALADAFGTVVSQNNTTIVKNENGHSSTDMFSLGGSDVKGEWIETVGDPQYNIFYEGGMLVIKVEVEGKAREIKSADIDLDVKLLRNGLDAKFESSEFKDGDDLYLYFKSPVNGHLAVYLLDEAAQEVYCLLPYKSSGEPTYTIEHDKPYVFFSSKMPDVKDDEVDEYNMTCSKSTEYNTVYVVFSPNMFAKANAADGREELPRQLSLKDFQTWLSSSRTKDLDMQLINKPIKITKE